MVLVVGLSGLVTRLRFRGRRKSKVSRSARRMCVTALSKSTSASKASGASRSRFSREGFYLILLRHGRLPPRRRRPRGLGDCVAWGGPKEIVWLSARRRFPKPQKCALCGPQAGHGVLGSGDRAVAVSYIKRRVQPFGTAGSAHQSSLLGFRGFARAHRAFAAMRPSWLRSSFVNFAIRALPPFLPISDAVGPSDRFFFAIVP